MTNEGKRNPSRIEFDHSGMVIEEDIDRLISTNFGLKGEKLEQHRKYLDREIPLLEELGRTLFLHLKLAYGMYPTCMTELEERRMHQKYAAGACYGIATLYERIFHYTGISADKHIEEIEHIRTELKAIKAWRENDRKRFRF